MTCQGCNRGKKVFSWVGGVVPSRPASRYGDQIVPYDMESIAEHYRRISDYNANDRRNKGSTD